MRRIIKAEEIIGPCLTNHDQALAEFEVAERQARARGLITPLNDPIEFPDDAFDKETEEFLRDALSKVG